MTVGFTGGPAKTDFSPLKGLLKTVFFREDRFFMRFLCRFFPVPALPAAYFLDIGLQVHCDDGFPHPEQTLSLISRPHFLQGVHPHVWHIVILPSACVKAS